MRAIRIYLLEMDGADSIKSELFSDVDNFLPVWDSRLKDSNHGALIYIGYSRPSNDIILKVLNDGQNKILFSSSAKFILEDLLNLSLVPQHSLNGYPLYVQANIEKSNSDNLEGRVSSLNLFDQNIKHKTNELSEDIPSWVVKGNSFTWFKDFSFKKPDIAAFIKSLGIVNDVTYQILENQLNSDLRLELAQHRAQFLKGLLKFEEVSDFCRVIPPWGLEISVDLLNFSVRTANRLNLLGIKLVGHFGMFTNDTLMNAPGFGRKSLNEVKLEFERQVELYLMTTIKSPDEINNNKEILENSKDSKEKSSSLKFIQAGEVDDAESLIELLVLILKEVNTNQANIFKDRVGLNGESQTLQEIADKLNLSRERIRQLETGAKKKFILFNFPDELRKRFDSIRDGMEIPLKVENLSIYDPWFEGISTKPWIVESLLNLFDVGDYRVHKYEGMLIIAPGEYGFIDNLIRTLRDFLKNSVSQQITKTFIRKKVSDMVSATSPELIEFILSEIYEHARFIHKDGQEILVSYGYGVDSLVMAILEQSDSPLNCEIILRKITDDFGQKTDINRVRNSCAINSYLFAPSTFGLRKHLNLSDAEISNVCDYVERLMLQKSKQWHCDEILREIPELLTEFSEPLDSYSLQICLNLSDRFTDLGRMVFSLSSNSSSGNEKRIEFFQFVEAILDKSPEPMHREEIYRQIMIERGLGTHSQIFQSGRLVSVAPATWALMDKHLNLSEIEYEKIVDELVTILKSTGHGLNPEELTSQISKELSSYKFIENMYLLFSLATKSKKCKKEEDFLYLAEWNEPRRVTQRRALKKVISEISTSGLHIREILSRASILYGHEINREAPYPILKEMGGFYDENFGKWFLQKAEK